jgi:AhpD family alkylhydroperoxidase
MMPFFKNLDELSDITDITWNDRTRLGPLDKASQNIMRGESSFTSAQKEVFAAFVSGLNACSFCYGSHATVAENFGVPKNTIEALVADIDSAPVAENERNLRSRRVGLFMKMQIKSSVKVGAKRIYRI